MLGELDRLVVGVALRQVDQDLGHDVLLIGQIDPGQDIGTVLLACKPRRLVVRGLLGQRVDRGAAHVGRLDQAVGVQRQEQLALALAGHLQAIAQAHDAIGVARHDHRVAAGRLELAAQLEGHREHDVLLVGAVGADRAGIDAAMAGIDHDDPLAGRRRRCFGGGGSP